jgi:hypothetical protein
VSDERFLSSYRVAVVAAGLVVRGVILNLWGARYALEAVVFGLGIGLLPYAALAVLARRLRVRWVLVSAGAAVLALDFGVWWSARQSDSSTAGVAVLLVPLLSLVLVVPIAAVLARFARR